MKRWSMIALGAAILGGAYSLSTIERDFESEEGRCSGLSEEDATEIARQYLAERLDWLGPSITGEGTMIGDFELVRFVELENMNETNFERIVRFEAPRSIPIDVGIYTNCQPDIWWWPND